MKNTRTLRTLARSLLGAALTSASAFAISPDDLSALRAKAETGDGIAQHNLGLVYANSQESISDLVEAYAWLNLAADNGATGRSLMIVTRQMTPEQIADGKRRFEQIRDAIASKKNIPAAVASRLSPISPASESPVSASPVRAAVAASADAEAREAELKKISAELAAAWKENDQLKTSVAKAEKDAAAAATALKAEKDRLASSLESASREIAGMKAASANFEGERNGLLQKITEAKTASDGELRLKVVALETELTKAGAVSKEREAARQSLATLGEQQQKLTAENQRLAGLVKQAETDSTGRVTEAQKGLETLRAELAAARTQQADAAKKITAGEKTVADLSAAQTRIRSLEAEAARYSGEKKDLAAKLAAATATAVSSTEVARINSQLADLKDRLSSSQQALAVANADVASLKHELQGAKNGVVPIQQHRELQAKLEGLAVEQQKLAQEELKKARDDAAAALAAAAAASTEEIGTLKAGAANFEGERNALLKKIADADQTLAAAKAEGAALAQQIELAKKESVPAQQHKELEAQLAAAAKAGEEEQKARAEIQKTLVALEAEKAELSEKLKALAEASTGEVATLKAGAANFEGERNGLLQKITEAEQALVRATADAATLKAQLASAEAASGNAARASADLVRVTQELDAAKKTAAASSQAVADARAEAADLKQQLAEAKTGVVSARQHQELQAKLDLAVKAQEQQQGSQSDLQKTIAALEAERSALAGKLAATTQASEGEAASLKAAAANFEGERNGLLQKITEAEQALVRANAETASAKEQVAAASKSSEAPAQEVRDLQSRLAAATRAQEEMAQQQAALQQTKNALENDGARLARELAAAQAASSDAGRAAASVQDLQARLRAAEETASAAGAERDSLAQRVAQFEQQAAARPASTEDPVELRKQLDEASARLATTLRSFENRQEEVDRLQKSLVSTDSERASLAGRISAAEKQAAEANAASTAGREASAQLAAMREQLRNAQNQVGQLAAENIQLKNRPASETSGTAASPGLVLSAPRRPASTSSPTSTPVRASQVAEARIHTVVEGENLTRIARRYYGNGDRWVEIYDANRASLPNPAALKIGMKLRIP